MGILSGTQPTAVHEQKVNDMNVYHDPTTGWTYLPVIGDFSSTTLESAIEAVEDAVKGLEGGYTTLIGKVSGGDFTTAYAAATQITLGSMPTSHPTPLVDDIEKVDAIDASGVTTTYTREEYAMAITGAGPTYTLTVTGATFGATDTFVVYTNVAKIANPNYFEDSAHTSGDPGTFMLSVRADSPTSTAGTDGNYAAIIQNADGKLYVIDSQLEDLEKNIVVAHDGVDAGNPLKIGGRARSSQMTGVAQNDRVDAAYSLYGELILAGYDYDQNAVQIMDVAPDWAHRTQSSDPDYSGSRLAAAGAGTTTEYLVIPFDTYKNGSIQIFGLTGGNASDTTTIKVFSSNDPDVDITTPDPNGGYFAGTKDAWTDVSQDILGGSQWQITGASTEDDDKFYIDTQFVCEYLLVEIELVKTDGVGDAKCDIFVKTA